MSDPFEYKDHFTVTEIAIIKIRRSWANLVFKSGIQLWLRCHLYIEATPGCDCVETKLFQLENLKSSNIWRYIIHV